MDEKKDSANQVNGEPAPQPVNAVAKVSLSSDGLVASMVISPPENGGAHITGKDIRSALVTSKVVFGIDHALIVALDKHPQYDETLVVARGQEPVDGEHATLEICVELSKDIKPKENADGSVDFKDLGIVQNVLTDQVLAVRTPPGKGALGKTVTGTNLLPKPGKDISLPMGQNTKASEDGLQLLAACDGQVDMVGQKLQVLNTFTVKGDVGVATGSIDFVGNVVVHGNILTGYHVQASGNITVNGEVENATVTAGGNIIVKNGIHGGGQSGSNVVKAGGFIKTKYIQDGNVIAGGDIESTSILQSYVQSDGNINVIGSKGRLNGGRVVARNAINTVNAGGRSVSILTILEVGNNPATIERNRTLAQELETLTAQMGSLQPSVTMLDSLEAAGSLPEGKREAYEQAKAALQAMQAKHKELLAEQKVVKEEMASLGYGTINVKGAAYPGVRVVIGLDQMSLETQYDNTTFARGGDGIYFGPYIA